jgi:hypothetical protein
MRHPDRRHASILERWGTATLAIVVAAGILAAVAGPVRADAPTPSAAFLELVPAAKRAAKLDQIANYLAARLVADIQKQPADKQAEWLRNFKSTLDLTAVLVTKEVATRDRGTVEVSAKRAGKAVTGTVAFVREHGSWKFVEQSWAVA